MIKRVKLETIYKMAKEDNEKIKDRKLFPDGWDEKVYDYYNKLSKESSDVEMFMEFLGGEDSPRHFLFALMCLVTILACQIAVISDLKCNGLSQNLFCPYRFVQLRI